MPADLLYRGDDEESRREVIDSTGINASGELLVSHKD